MKSAGKNLRLTVTAADCERAKQERSSGRLIETCPVAQALCRRFPGESVSVGIVGANAGDTEYKLSRRATRWIERWDAKANPPVPATFILREDQP